MVRERGGPLPLPSSFRRHDERARPLSDGLFGLPVPQAQAPLGGLRRRGRPRAERPTRVRANHEVRGPALGLDARRLAGEGFQQRRERDLGRSPQADPLPWEEPGRLAQRELPALRRDPHADLDPARAAGDLAHELALKMTVECDDLLLCIWHHHRTKDKSERTEMPTPTQQRIAVQTGSAVADIPRGAGVKLLAGVAGPS